MPQIVAIAGSPSPQSRTRQLIEQVQQRIASETGSTTGIVDVADLLPCLAVRTREEAAPKLLHALRMVEEADLLLVGSPVYKGSYTGLFKHLIDLLDYKALMDRPVGLVAMGGTDRHALIIDHQLRPLFSFFNAQTLPTGVFVSERAFVDGRIEDPALRDRLAKLVQESVDALKRRATERSLRAA